MISISPPEGPLVKYAQEPVFKSFLNLYRLFRAIDPGAANRCPGKTGSQYPVSIFLFRMLLKQVPDTQKIVDPAQVIGQLEYQQAD